jgi:hypothetical protein
MTDTSYQPDVFMLTTFDNPYDPFTQWDEWFVWDMRAGYNTPGLLDRWAHHSSELSDVDEHLAIQQAIDEIITENVSGMHRKLKRGEFATLVPANATGTPDATPEEEE